MNEKKRKRVDSTDWRSKSDRVTKTQIIAITKEYEKRHKAGGKSESILIDIAGRFGKNTRTIERYIAQGREALKEKKGEKEVDRLRRDLWKGKYIEHCNRLAIVAKIFAHRLNEIHNQRPDNYSGNIVDGIEIWTRYTKHEPEIDGIGISQHIPNENDAAYLLAHFNRLYPELKMESWEKLTGQSPNVVEIIEKLSDLALGKDFTLCPECRVCRIWKDMP